MTAPRKQDIQYFDEHVKELPTKFLECRDMRHAWKVQSGFRAVGEVKSGVKFVQRTLECQRCKTERVDVLSVRTFDRVSTQYRYPTGYTIPGNTAGNRGQSIRAEVYARSVN